MNKKPQDPIGFTAPQTRKPLLLSAPDHHHRTARRSPHPSQLPHSTHDLRPFPPSKQPYPLIAHPSHLTSHALPITSHILLTSSIYSTPFRLLHPSSHTHPSPLTINIPTATPSSCFTHSRHYEFVISARHPDSSLPRRAFYPSYSLQST